ncbi:MAG: tyrosine-protein phosphatase [Deltaproteobacteria bacterium]|nr:tyrosine-protein phosphatase [Deltaproteobacteria bacterium]
MTYSPDWLDWPGVWNARDLGGVRTARGVIAPGALIRSSHLDNLGEPGLVAMHAAGVRTVIDLRNLRESSIAPPLSTDGPFPVTVARVLLPIEEHLDDDPEFADWIRTGTFATALYFARFLARWPERVVQVLRAVAVAAPGGVVLHCAQGKDRTGLTVAMLLAVLGVESTTITEDHGVTEDRMASDAALGHVDPGELGAMARLYDQAGRTRAEAMAAFLQEATEFLGGLDPALVAALDARLVRPTSG